MWAEPFLGAISDDGQHVLFDSISPPGVFVRDRSTARTELLSVSSAGEPASSASFGGAITADGRVAAFWSDASNLVPGDANGLSDVFARDRRASVTQRVSVSIAGGDSNGNSAAYALDADGTLAIFESHASNLVAGDTNDATDVFARRVLASPSRKEDCKHGGWRRFGFRNQGQCIAFVHEHGQPGPQR